VGEVASKDLAEKFETLNALRNASEEDLTLVRGIGPVTAACFVAFFNSRVTEALINQLVSRGFEPVEEKTQRGNSLEKETIVFTGTLSMPRSQARKLAEDAGAKVTGSITARTTILVAGENAGSKLDNAEKLGVTVLNEAEFFKIISELR
jgi:DNA ligase (NAD+)